MHERLNPIAATALAAIVALSGTSASAAGTSDSAAEPRLGRQAIDSRTEATPPVPELAPTVEIESHESDGTISATIAAAQLGEVALALQEMLGLEVEIPDPTLDVSPATDSRFDRYPLPRALGELLRGYSYVTVVDPTDGHRIVRLYASNSAPERGADPSPTDIAPRVARRAPRSPATSSATRTGGGPTNLEGLYSLGELERNVEDLREELPGDESEDELDREARLEEIALAEEQLRRARAQRALDALSSDHGSRLKSDAVSELVAVGSDNPRATAALMEAAIDTSLGPNLRQHALEQLVNVSADAGFEDAQLLEVLQSLSGDTDFAVSSTARRALEVVERELAKHKQ